LIVVGVSDLSTVPAAIGLVVALALLGHPPVAPALEAVQLLPAPAQD
jgi:hypothetical protein